jgi:hypothetical protein
LKLGGTHFKYKRCNRKELQKDVDRLKRRIQAVVMKDPPSSSEVTGEKVVDPSRFEAARKMYCDWSNLLSELLYVPGHRDFVNVRRGIKNCLWLQPGSSNVVKVKEDEALRKAKSKYKGSDQPQKLIPRENNNASAQVKEQSKELSEELKELKELRTKKN